MIRSHVHELKFIKKFCVICPTFPLREMPPDVENDLSTDQRHAYRMYNSEDDHDRRHRRRSRATQLLKVGAVCPSRWLKTVSRPRWTQSESLLLDHEMFDQWLLLSVVRDKDRILHRRGPISLTATNPVHSRIKGKDEL